MEKEIPNIVWMLWFQGWENALVLVKKCKATWEKRNPTWKIHFLTTQTVSDFIDLEAIIPGYVEKKMPPEALSNVIRMSLLRKYGGVWADSTLYCNDSLDNWLPQRGSPSGFFAFANPGPDRMLSNWFLASTAQHTIIEKWYQATIEYWGGRTERHTYFWCHYLFGDLYNQDDEVKRLWDKTPKFSADAPHYFLPYEEMFFRTLSEKEKKAIDIPTVPLFKLTHKYNEQLVSDASVLRYLLSDKRFLLNTYNMLRKIFVKDTL